MCVWEGAEESQVLARSLRNAANEIKIRGGRGGGQSAQKELANEVKVLRAPLNCDARRHDTCHGIVRPVTHSHRLHRRQTNLQAQLERDSRTLQ